MATLSNARLQFFSSRRLPDRIWAEGDSYMAGASGAGLSISLRALGHVVINAAVGGATMSDIRDRLIADGALARQCKVIVWDGSQNGYTTAGAYADQLGVGLAAIGGNFIVIPAAVPFGTADQTQQLAIREEFVARWGSKVFDWRGAIPATAGVINQDRMLNYPTDAVHLNATAHGEMAAAVAAGL